MAIWLGWIRGGQPRRRSGTRRRSRGGAVAVTLALAAAVTLAPAAGYAASVRSAPAAGYAADHTVSAHRHTTDFRAKPGSHVAPKAGHAGPVAGEADPVSHTKPVLTLGTTNSVIVPGAISTGTEPMTQVEFLVEIHNPTDTAVPAGEVTLSIATEKSTGSLDADEDSAPVAIVTTGAFPDTPAEATRSKKYSVDIADFPAEFTQHSPNGIYRITAEFHPESTVTKKRTRADRGSRPNTERLTGDSTVIWGALRETAPAPVSLVVPLVYPEKVWSLPTRSHLAEVFGKNAKLPKLLTEAERMHATLAIDPRVVVGIRAYGDDAPADAKAFLQRLENTSLPTFFLQYADADLSTQAELGRVKPLTPTGASFVIEDPAASDAADPKASAAVDPKASAAAPKPASEPSADPGLGSDEASIAQRRDALEQLAHWHQTAGATVWPAEGSVTQKTLQLTGSTPAENLVLDSRNVTLSGGPVASLGGTTAIVGDGEIHDALARSIVGETATVRANAEARALALLGLAAEAGSPGVVVTLDRAAVTDAQAQEGADPAAVLQRLAQQRWLSFVPVAKQQRGSATLVPAAPAHDRLEQLKTVLAREKAVRRVADTLVHPEFLVDYQRMRILSLLGTRWTRDSERFADTLEDFRVRDAQLISGVQVVGSARTQVFGSASRIPVQLRNELPFTTVVRGAAEPASGALTVDDGDMGTLRIPPDETVTVLVPIHSRVTSGSSAIIVTIAADSTKRVIATQSVDVAISSQVETIVVVITGLAAAAFVGFGVWRSVRRKRHGTDTTPVATVESIQ